MGVKSISLELGLALLVCAPVARASDNWIMASAPEEWICGFSGSQPAQLEISDKGAVLGPAFYRTVFNSPASYLGVSRVHDKALHPTGGWQVFVLDKRTGAFAGTIIQPNKKNFDVRAKCVAVGQ
jgi:hypothetical protein